MCSALCLLCSILGLLSSGCATGALDAARRDFYRGNATNAVAVLAEAPAGNTDKVLFHMERGMIRQAAGVYEASARDFAAAVGAIERLDRISVTRSAASLVTSDDVITFRGFPYERVLLHAFAAHNYLALRLWDDAAVEARNIISMLENREGFPDDAYSRYLAGLCLELQGDADAARRQYEAADRLVDTLTITPSGRLVSVSDPPTSDLRPPTSELVCLVAVGRGPDGRGRTPAHSRWGPRPYAEIRAGGRSLGRSYTLVDTRGLWTQTRAKVAALQAAKDVGRVVLKDSVARAVANRNEALGALLWVVMFAFEGRPERRWETLPYALQVARVPCPQDLREYTVVFRTTSGAVRGRKTVRVPLARRRSTYVSFCRDIP